MGNKKALHWGNLALCFSHNLNKPGVIKMIFKDQQAADRLHNELELLGDIVAVPNPISAYNGQLSGMQRIAAQRMDELESELSDLYDLGSDYR